MANEVFAFEVSVAGTDWTQIINARSRGMAKSQYFRQVTDAWPLSVLSCRPAASRH